MLKILNLTLVILLISSCTSVEKERVIPNATEVLMKSITAHDPLNKWQTTNFNVHVQEPRIGNPYRYSKVKLNRTTGAFELLRNREEKVSKHIIDAEGKLEVYLNDQIITDAELIKKYRLDPERNKVYKNFYHVLHGLPMSIHPDVLEEIGEVQIKRYNKEECYEIPIVLKEETFSKHWVIYINQTNYKFKGMQIVFPEDATKGERLHFDGEIQIGDITIPRIRHWYDHTNGDYLGSDIIVKELQ